ncbi:exosome 3'-_5 exonuclease subunit ski4 (Csl4) [Oleoguttula sp. CCFEE 5521]
MTSTIVLPGQPLGPSSTSILGPGSHIHAGHIYSSLAGPLAKASTSKAAPQPTLTVSRPTGILIPETGTIVLGRITRTNPRQANLSILALGPSGEHTCRDSFPAIIRQQDIRATEIDKVKVAESFRVGDVVRATVISLGDERSYFCGTAKNELGVVMAVSEGGDQMVPVSWREFLDERTGARELRKVAKPV